jgi:hypothetical protein
LGLDNLSFNSLAFHAWLEEERAISRSLLLAPRFAGRVRVDSQANAVFLHADQDGPSGYEIKNRGYTGFAKDGGACGSRRRGQGTRPW